jgi:hypothetical protein
MKLQASENGWKFVDQLSDYQFLKKKNIYWSMELVG